MMNKGTITTIIALTAASIHAMQTGDLNFDITFGEFTAEQHLICAVQNNHTEHVLEWIRRGAHIDYQDPRTGRTALMEAARMDHQEIAILLINCGAHKEIKDNNKATASDMAISDEIQHIIDHSEKRITWHTRRKKNCLERCCCS